MACFVHPNGWKLKVNVMEKLQVMLPGVVLLVFTQSCGEKIIAVAQPEDPLAESLCSNVECPSYSECSDGNVTQFSAGVCQLDSSNEPVCFYPEGEQFDCNNGCDGNQCAGILDSCEGAICPDKTQCTNNHQDTLVGTCEYNAQNQAECVYVPQGNGEDCPYGCDGSVCADANNLCEGVICPDPETECTNGVITYFEGYCAVDGAAKTYCRDRVVFTTECDFGCNGNVCANQSD